MEYPLNENLQCIFCLISFEDKMKCMLVCRLWAKLLRSRTLFETVNICQIYRLGNLIHVDRLILHDCVPGGERLEGKLNYSRFNLDKLLEACPASLESLTIQNSELGLDFWERGNDSVIYERNSFTSESESLLLPNHRLWYISVHSVYNPHHADIIVTTLNDYKPRLYSYERSPSFMNDTS
ncbi:hypothetical protein K501DRAFT_269862 [Backusella circina FSU 941]|nr:hypothetical protein K501DRAFT_269862 [Backusella circina FSU 941]